MKKTQGKMLLAIDIGNSTLGLGLFPDETDSGHLHIKRLSSTPAPTESRLRKAIRDVIAAASESGACDVTNHRKIGLIISSVVPALNDRVLSAVKEFCTKPLILGYVSSGLKFRVNSPESIGADRLANAVAGYNLTHKPVAVVDFGTATTISVVGKKGAFIGGTIMPGLELMFGSLASRTAKLPCVGIQRPDRALGLDTNSAITAGIVFGTAGAVMKIVSSIEEETGLELSLVITGGRSGTISPFIERPHFAVPDLIFEGLRLIHGRVRDLR
jgi:type III pantothenate kinase